MRARAMLKDFVKTFPYVFCWMYNWMWPRFLWHNPVGFKILWWLHKITCPDWRS